MTLQERVDSFAALGTYLQSEGAQEEVESWIRQANSQNAWFTPPNVKAALDSIAKSFLKKEHLQSWMATFDFSTVQPQKIGVVMAGNVPAVGFHDMLCVLITGNYLHAKLSSQDSVLIQHLANTLIKLNQAWVPFIQFVERLNDVDAIIATGSDNSARYFKYYFGKKPHIIRQNRTSCAILKGDETEETLKILGEDILQYFGLGCRNVSKLYVPLNYKFDTFFEAIESMSSINSYSKYNNNYDYNKSILLVNGVLHLDNGFLLITENPALVSPVSVVYFEYYEDSNLLYDQLSKQADRIQCTVSNDGWFRNSVPFGKAQSPELMDYADGVDIIQFLINLPK